MTLGSLVLAALGVTNPSAPVSYKLTLYICCLYFWRRWCHTHPFCHGNSLCLLLLYILNTGCQRCAVYTNEAITSFPSQGQILSSPQPSTEHVWGPSLNKNPVLLGVYFLGTVMERFLSCLSSKFFFFLHKLFSFVSVSDYNK